MRPLARWLIRLYPGRWRERYGEEFEALLEDSSPGWRAALDLLKGAIRMQLHVPSFPKLAVVLSILGAAAGFGVSWFMTPKYVSSVEMQFAFGPATPAQNRQDLRERLIQMEQQVLSRTSLNQIIQDPGLDLYRRERERTPLEDVIEQMRRHDLRIQFPAATADYVPFSISFEYSDREKARQTVQALAAKFSDMNLVMQNATQQVKDYQSRGQIERLEARIAVLEKRLGIAAAPAGAADTFVPGFSGINLEVLDPPSLPVRPISPNRAIFIAAGFGAGFALAIVIAVFRRSPPAIPFPAQTA